MRILVLGSAPGATIPPSDVLYSANISLSRHRADRVITGKSNIVVGEQIIAAEADTKASDLDKKSREILVKMTCDEMIITRHDPWFIGWYYERAIKDFKCKNVSELSHQDRRTILLEVTCLREPIISLNHFIGLLKLPINTSIDEINSIIDHRKGYQSGILQDSHATTRPSTGMLALLLAISRHGEKSEYIVSGITSLRNSDRSLYFGGGNNGGFKGLPHHLYADIKILNVIKKKYRVHII